ncbi:hypothetical protein WJX79_005622 [Trebouxia sp. C0005]
MLICCTGHSLKASRAKSPEMASHDERSVKLKSKSKRRPCCISVTHWGKHWGWQPLIELRSIAEGCLAAV